MRQPEAVEITSLGHDVHLTGPEVTPAAIVRAAANRTA